MRFGGLALILVTCLEICFSHWVVDIVVGDPYCCDAQLEAYIVLGIWDLDPRPNSEACSLCSWIDIDSDILDMIVTSGSALFSCSCIFIHLIVRGNNE